MLTDEVRQNQGLNHLISHGDNDFSLESSRFQELGGAGGGMSGAACFRLVDKADAGVLSCDGGHDLAGHLAHYDEESLQTHGFEHRESAYDSRNSR